MDHFVKLWKDRRGSCAKDIPKIILQLKENFQEELLKYPFFIEDIRTDMETKTYTKVVKGRIHTLTIENASSSTSSPKKAGPKTSVFYFYDKNEKGQDPPAIAEAKCRVKNKVLELIHDQRLAYMMQGQSFRRPQSGESKGKEMAIFCKLSKNQKYLYYWDMARCEDTSKEGILKSKDKVAVENILKIETSDEMITKLGNNGSGTDAKIGLSGLHDLLKIQVFQLSISFENDVHRKIPRDQFKLELVARDRKAFDYFYDGLNILKKFEQRSAKFFEDFKELEKMESRMTFMQANNEDLNKTLPKIPPPPSNYNFCKHHFSNGKVLPIETRS